MSPLELKTVKVAPFVGDLARRYAPYGLRFGNRLRNHPVAEARIQTSARMLQRILEDLIHAAFSRSPESAELTIHSESASLEFRVADRGSVLLVDLDDDLAATKLAVERLGGTLWIETNAPRGAVVCFTLPMGN